MRAVLLALVVGCASPPSTELYPHPWPDEHLRRPDGTLQLDGFPSGNGAEIRDDALNALRGTGGFGLTSPILFPFDGHLDPASLPDVRASLDPNANVFVINVDRRSPAYGRRSPVDAAFLPDGGPFGGTNLLVVLPYPGIPLLPDTLYAAVVTTRTRYADGSPVEATVGRSPTAAHITAREALVELGVPLDSIAQIAVIRTEDPTSGLFEAVAQVGVEERVELEPPELVESFSEYCVFRSSTWMPVYQRGEPPYERNGGEWVARDGRLVLQARLESTVWITVPRSPEPTYPSAVLVRAGAGGDRPLVDRGPRDRDGVSEPGTGIARELSQAGYIGLSVDGPLGGRRNLTGWDEQTAIFNVRNPPALRDNVRQTALELVLFARAIEGFAFDGSACEGGSPEITLDLYPVLIGHSTGATIAPLAAAVEPRFSALILSGAGASWIRQVVHKRSPVPLRPVAEMLFDYWPHRELTEHDPLLGLLQWAGEPADTVVYGRLVQNRPVLVFQGILDTYIPPPIANPLAMSLGLDLAGRALDEDLGYRAALSDLALTGGTQRTLPTDSGSRPRFLTQHASDGIEDGHEVLFQRADARHQLRCFLASLREGRPRLVASSPGRAAGSSASSCAPNTSLTPSP